VSVGVGDVVVSVGVVEVVVSVGVGAVVVCVSVGVVVVVVPVGVGVVSVGVVVVLGTWTVLVPWARLLASALRRARSCSACDFPAWLLTSGVVRSNGAPWSCLARCGVSDGRPLGMALNESTPPWTVPRSFFWIGR
jgi:hypothetical protein